MYVTFDCQDLEGRLSKLGIEQVSEVTG